MKPFSLWSADLTLKKMIIAENYEDLLRKGTWKSRNICLSCKQCLGRAFGYICIKAISYKLLIL